MSQPTHPHPYQPDPYQSRIVLVPAGGLAEQVDVLKTLPQGDWPVERATAPPAISPTLLRPNLIKKSIMYATSGFDMIDRALGYLREIDEGAVKRYRHILNDIAGLVSHLEKQKPR